MTTRSSRPLAAAPTIALAALVGLAGLSAGGCLAYRPYFNEGGSGANINQFTYVSTSHQPKTVKLVDTRTNEVIWTCDIPVGQQLTCQFYKDKSPDDPWRPNTMRWGLYKAGTKAGKHPYAIAVPEHQYCRMDGYVRGENELPAQASTGM